jgi:hypothetical protein
MCPLGCQTEQAKAVFQVNPANPAKIPARRFLQMAGREFFCPYRKTPKSTPQNLCNKPSLLRIFPKALKIKMPRNSVWTPHPRIFRANFLQNNYLIVNFVEVRVYQLFAQ